MSSNFMTHSLLSSVTSLVTRVRASSALFLAAALCVVAAGCGGSADAPPPPENGPPSTAANAPVITQQPVNMTVTSGQAASFTVAATGTAPLAYQWQRNGVAIAGATGTTYSIAAAALSDSGAIFRAVVSNLAGSATSNDATLAVTIAAPVLTITRQPASASVTAGATASFTVAATCSAGTLDIQWQRNSGAGGSFVAIAGANTTSLAIATASTDNGAMVRASLDCSGQSGTSSNPATLNVVAPGATRLDPLAIVGLRDQAVIGRIGGIVAEPAGSFVFTTNGLVKRLSADLSSITLVAGSNTGQAVDGPAASAGFVAPRGIARDAAGNLYVVEASRVRRIGADGVVSTLAGGDNTGNADGTGSAATFQNLRGIALGADGDLYVTDDNNHNVRRVTVTGVVTTYAGSTASNGAQSGFLDSATPLAARFFAPSGIAAATNGDLFVADSRNHRIRRIARSGTAAGAVSTLAGSGTTDPAAPDGVGAAAVIESPWALTLQGNTLTVLQKVGLVRQIDLSTAAVTTLTGTYRATGSGYADGGRGQALFDVLGDTSGIAPVAAGGFLLGDTTALHIISSTGIVKTIAVLPNAQAVEGGTLAQRPFILGNTNSQTITVDAGGNVVVASSGDVRRISLAGVVSVVAGLPGGLQGMLDGVGSNAQFVSVGDGIASGPDNTLYVEDAESIRKIDPLGNTTLLAGYRSVPNDFSGMAPFGAVDGDAATARFQNRLAFAVGPDGALYVADVANYAIRRVDAAGNTTTYAGALGQPGSAGGSRTTARFTAPASLGFAPDGSLYVIDGANLRRISADGSSVTNITGLGISATRLAVDASGNVFLAATGGLYMVSAGTTTATRLIAGGIGDDNAYGNVPHLGTITAIAVAGPKQIVMIAANVLVKATLP